MNSVDRFADCNGALLCGRWAPENKHKLNPYAYTPFGLGPRNCVGMRFAMEELKLALCSIVSRFEFSRSKDTPVGYETLPR